MKCKCKLCGYEWLARTKSPKQCPRCKRYNWDKERKTEIKLIIQKNLRRNTMKSLIENIKEGQTDNTHTNGYELARKIANEHTQKTGNRCIVQRVLDNVDQFNGRNREWFSFDVVEIT